MPRGAGRALVGRVSEESSDRVEPVVSTVIAVAGWATVARVDMAAGAQTIEVATASAAPATRQMAVFEGDMEQSLVGGHTDGAESQSGLGRDQTIRRLVGRPFVLQVREPPADEQFDNSSERRRRAGRAPQNGAEKGKPLRVGSKGLR